VNNENTNSYLSSSTTVGQYRDMERNKDIEGIVKFFEERIKERYISPFSDKKYKNGFIMMASACLMIESLESFWQGWNKSPNSSLAFCQFFSRNPRFDTIRGLTQEFYVNIRCGIMHQGETTGGWHIRRDMKQLFELETKTIDATKFLSEMKQALKDYCKTLKANEWDHEIWKKLRKKMNNVCRNTETKE